jgi:hypothetical protein
MSMDEIKLYTYSMNGHPRIPSMDSNGSMYKHSFIDFLWMNGISWHSMRK